VSSCAWQTWAIAQGRELSPEDQRTLCAILAREADGIPRIMEILRTWHDGPVPHEARMDALSAAQVIPPSCQIMRERCPDVCGDCDLDARDPADAMGEDEFPCLFSLLQKELPPITWIVPEVLPQGLSFFAGKPKSMKSFTMFDCCLAVATGGEWLGYPCERGSVLYLSLEDPLRRVQPRARQLAEDLTPDDDISVVFDAPSLGHGLTKLLERWLSSRGSSARLIVIDTWAKVRPAKGKFQGTDYEREYGDLQALKHITDEYNIALVLVHHTIKSAPDDVMDSLHGTTGTLGAVDGAMVLYRRPARPGVVFLQTTHKDAPFNLDLALEWDQEAARYRVLGDAEDYQGTDLQQSIHGVLRRLPGSTPRTIVTELRQLHVQGLNDDNKKAANAIAQALQRMKRSGMVSQNGSRGAWYPETPS